MSHVYFPTTAIVSLLYVLEDGASAEIAVVGREGVVGISLFMGGESTPSRAVVQSAGKGYRLIAIYVPLWLAKHNKLVFGGLCAVAVIFALAGRALDTV